MLPPPSSLFFFFRHGSPSSAPNPSPPPRGGNIRATVVLLGFVGHHGSLLISSFHCVVVEPGCLGSGRRVARAGPVSFLVVDASALLQNWLRSRGIRSRRLAAGQPRHCSTRVIISDRARNIVSKISTEPVSSDGTHRSSTCTAPKHRSPVEIRFNGSKGKAICSGVVVEVSFPVLLGFAGHRLGM